MDSHHHARSLRHGAPARHRVGRPRSGRRAATARSLLAVAVAATASLVACGGSGERDTKPSSTWDEMRWDEGVWE